MFPYYLRHSLAVFVKDTVEIIPVQCVARVTGAVYFMIGSVANNDIEVHLITRFHLGFIRTDGNSEWLL
jgi:hypothetical protein